MSYIHHMANVNHQLHEMVSSKDRANAREEEFGNKLHLISEVTSNICIPKGEQVRKVGTERLPSLNGKFYKWL